MKTLSLALVAVLLAVGSASANGKGKFRGDLQLDSLGPDGQLFQNRKPPAAHRQCAREAMVRGRRMTVVSHNCLKSRGLTPNGSRDVEGDDI